MGNSKKKNSSGLGPLVFFPRQTEEEKHQAYQDTKAFDRNIFRLAVLIGYGMMGFFLTKATGIGRMFTEARPLQHYLIFIAPLILSIIEWRVIRQGKRTGIPVPKATRYFIYGVWLVSALYYSVYLYRYLAGS
jgi:hypothetical protein